MKKLLLTMVLGITAVSLAPQSSQAALLFYDGFDYSPSTSLGAYGTGLPGAGDWYAVSGETSNVVSAPGLTYTGLSTVGNDVADTGGGAYANVHNISGVSTGNGSEVWLSFLATSNNASNTRIGLFSSGPLTSNGVAAYVTSNGRVGVGNMNVDSDPNMVYSANDAVNWSNTNLIVMRVVFASGNDSIHLWVNPTIGSTPTDGSAAVTNTFNITVASYSDIYGVNIANPLIYRMGGSWQGTLDEFRVGTSFADVTPVPEPTTWALLAGGLTTVMILRRRRRA